MISMPLLKKNISSLWKVFVIIYLVMTMYFSIIIYMFDPELSEMMDQFQKVMPQMMSAFGMAGAATTLISFMQTYLYGFIMLVFPMIFSMIAMNNLLVRYGEDGSLACILATPNSRRKIILTQLFALLIGISLLIILITLTGIAVAEILFPNQLEIEPYLKLNGALLLTHLAIAGIVFLAACLFQEAKWYYTIGAGIPILFFLLNMLANMGDKLENLKYFTIFTLFPDLQIIAGESGVVEKCAALGIISIILYFIGVQYFIRKDLNL